ncbi:MAG: DUF1659 domain-containing protein [Selenomonadaceae bacterium]|nr:DUF1659 domain-containing protein [Selenomonadaceae bacterium]
MAVRRNAASRLTLKVITAVDEGGAATLASRSVAHLNPTLTDEEVRLLGVDIAGLQQYELDSVSRTDSAELAAE